MPEEVPGIKNGWFTDTATMWPGQRSTLALANFSNDAIVFHERSEFQDITVFRSAQYGKVLVIDGILQLTERDECAYHEMMAHLPLFSHPNPKRVLIVGGGDGVIVREVCRHEQVEKITLVEIDPMVIDVTRKFLQEIVPPAVFEDPRLEIIYADGAEYMQEVAAAAATTHDNDSDNTTGYDVILGDTLDPLGPAESLFQPEFYEAMYTVLRDENGIICTQGECFWIHLELIRDLLGCCADIFAHAEYASTMVPSLPCGQIGFVLARKGKSENGMASSSSTDSFRIPVRTPTPAFQSDLKWYNPQVHQAAFVLPQYIQKELEPLYRRHQPAHDGRYLGRFHELNDKEDIEDSHRCFLGDCSIL